jgi:hypothetical protein
MLQSLEDIPDSAHNYADKGEGSEQEDYVPKKPVSMNDAKLAPLCSINEIAMDFYD